MPSLRFASPTTPDALSNKKFSVIPARGAVMNLWGAGATAGDVFGISSGDRDLMVVGSEANIEIAVDVVDVQRDQLLFNELVNGGQLFLPVTATAEMQFLINLRFL